jgi:hypothetical protein
MACAKSIQCHPPEGHRDDVRERSARPKGLGHGSSRDTCTERTLAPGVICPFGTNHAGESGVLRGNGRPSHRPEAESLREHDMTFLSSNFATASRSYTC